MFQFYKLLTKPEKHGRLLTDIMFKIKNKFLQGQEKHYIEMPTFTELNKNMQGLNLYNCINNILHGIMRIKFLP